MYLYWLESTVSGLLLKISTFLSFQTEIGNCCSVDKGCWSGRWQSKKGVEASGHCRHQQLEVPQGCHQTWGISSAGIFKHTHTHIKIIVKYHWFSYQTISNISEVLNYTVLLLLLKQSSNIELAFIAFRYVNIWLHSLIFNIPKLCFSLIYVFRIRRTLTWSRRRRRCPRSNTKSNSVRSERPTTWGGTCPFFSPTCRCAS